jgi:hypothetical protein
MSLISSTCSFTSAVREAVSSSVSTALSLPLVSVMVTDVEIVRDESGATTAVIVCLPDDATRDRLLQQALDSESSLRQGLPLLVQATIAQTSSVPTSGGGGGGGGGAGGISADSSGSSASSFLGLSLVELIAVGVCSLLAVLVVVCCCSVRFYHRKRANNTQQTFAAMGRELDGTVTRRTEFVAPLPIAAVHSAAFPSHRQQHAAARSAPASPRSPHDHASERTPPPPPPPRRSRLPRAPGHAIGRGYEPQADDASDAASGAAVMTAQLQAASHPHAVSLQLQAADTDTAAVAEIELVVSPVTATAAAAAPACAAE